MLIIKKLREKKNLTQNDLAQLIGVSLRTISNYENGDVQIPDKKLRAIAKVFNVDVFELLKANFNDDDVILDVKSSDEFNPDKLDHIMSELKKVLHNQDIIAKAIARYHFEQKKK